MTRVPTIALLRLSDSFGAVWGDMVGEAGGALAEARPDEIPAGLVALLLAAGGEERHALDVLPAIAEGQAGVPILVVGADSSHRFAVEALRRGATDYFALPGDADLLRRTLTSLVDASRQRQLLFMFLGLITPSGGSLSSSAVGAT